MKRTVLVVTALLGLVSAAPAHAQGLTRKEALTARKAFEQGASRATDVFKTYKGVDRATRLRVAYTLGVSPKAVRHVSYNSDTYTAKGGYEQSGVRATIHTPKGLVHAFMNFAGAPSARPASALALSPNLAPTYVDLELAGRSLLAPRSLGPNVALKARSNLKQLINEAPGRTAKAVK